MGLLGKLKTELVGEKKEQGAVSPKDAGVSPKRLVQPTVSGMGPYDAKGDKSLDNSEKSSMFTGSGTSSSGKSGYVEQVRHEIMCNYMWQQQQSNLWIDNREELEQGIMLRRSRGTYVSAPPDLAYSQFAENVSAMNLPSAMTVASKIIGILLDCAPDATDVPLRNGLRVQVLPTLEDLRRARIPQCAAFIAKERLLVVWDDEPRNLLDRAQSIEDDLMELVWAGEGESDAPMTEKNKPQATITATMNEKGDMTYDVESGLGARPVKIFNTVYVTGTMFLVIVFIGFGTRTLVVESMVDRSYLRLLLLLLIPVQIFFSLFFWQVVIGCFAQIFGPIKHMNENSRFYSGKPPPRITGTLPHITIQCPVYKEGLQGVIQPTVRSIKAAISTYELQGGTANILINDDGLQLISEEKRQERIDFYADNSIGWTARPGHGVDGFVRRGKFKKASNMNYGLMLTNQVEDMLATIERDESWSQADEASAYSHCLTSILDQHEGRAWADGNIRIGDYIILIDSDTEVPVDCLLDAASEMELYPEVGIMQFASGVMQVVHTYFEDGITFFTNLVYTAIRFCVANGDSAPFVGHNAILRWSAIQQVGHYDEDGYEKFWSESHVSEDFDMSLRLQCNDYIVRLGAWPGCDGFKEGVSLTVYDELARWEKYAYGCNELLFNPLRYWPTRGPFTGLFMEFLKSNIPFTSKITIISYIGTYYAIGAAWILTLVNYFVVGWFNGYLDVSLVSFTDDYTH